MSDKRHGGLSMRFRAEYDALRDAICRCHREDHKSYQYYGARGIRVSDRWRHGAEGRTGFELFLADVGPRPGAGLSLDRIDNDRGYEPGNVRWATWSTQAKNRRRCGTVNRSAGALLIEMDGETRSLSDWCRRFGAVQYHTAFRRLKRGWEPKRAITEPPVAAAKA